MKLPVVKHSAVNAITFLSLSIFMLVAPISSAEIFQCTSIDGAVEFTDTPCMGPGSEIVNIEERYTSGPPGLRPYELERLAQLDETLRLEKLMRYDARQAYAALEPSDPVLCRSAQLHLGGHYNRAYAQYGYYLDHNNRYAREQRNTLLLKQQRYCR